MKCKHFRCVHKVGFCILPLPCRKKSSKVVIYSIWRRMQLVTMHACAYIHVGWGLSYCHCSNLGWQSSQDDHLRKVCWCLHTHAWAHAHIKVCICMHSLPVVAYTTAGVALLLPSPSAQAVILYWAPGTVGLIVTLLLPPVLTYSPIIGTPKRVTSYPVISGLVMASLLWTWYTTAEVVALYTVRLGTLRGSERTIHGN